MRTMKIGLALLTVWCSLEIAVAAWVTTVTLRGGQPPALALVLPQPRISTIDPVALAVINAQAMLANPCICAVCAMALALAWLGVARTLRWPLWVLVGTLVPLQAAAFASDGFLGHRNLVANLVSALMLVTSLALCVVGSYRR
jgi:hypothetical protein